MRFSLNRIRKNQGQLLNRLSYSYVSDGFVVRTVPRGLPRWVATSRAERGVREHSADDGGGRQARRGSRGWSVCTPPDAQGRVNPAILAAAGIAA